MDNLSKFFVLMSVFLLSFFLSGCTEGEVDSDTVSGIIEGEVLPSDQENGEAEDGLLEMQGYYLSVPDGYTCTGGFTDGYRYLDADCVPEDRSDYSIEVQRSLPATRISEEGIVANQLGVRSRELSDDDSAGLCEEIDQEYGNQKMGNLNAEHYVCFHEQDGKPVITLGVAKNFSGYARWFEAHLTVEEESDLSGYDFVDILADFLNNAVIIDWSDFED